nr:periphilin-1 isoform X3 [Taeniopygia guttata]
MECSVGLGCLLSPPRGETQGPQTFIISMLPFPPRSKGKAHQSFSNSVFKGILSTAKMGEELLGSITPGFAQSFTQEGQIWLSHFVPALPPQTTRHVIYFRVQCEQGDIKATEPQTAQQLPQAVLTPLAIPSQRGPDRPLVSCLPIPQGPEASELRRAFATPAAPARRPVRRGSARGSPWCGEARLGEARRGSGRCGKARGVAARLGEAQWRDWTARLPPPPRPVALPPTRSSRRGRGQWAAAPRRRAGVSADGSGAPEAAAGARGCRGAAAQREREAVQDCVYSVCSTYPRYEWKMRKVGEWIFRSRVAKIDRKWHIEEMKCGLKGDMTTKEFQGNVSLQGFMVMMITTE